MGYITVKRKGYRRKDGTWVKATTYRKKDTGKPGKTPKSKQWFEAVGHTGWRKTQKESTRRSKLLAATDARRSTHGRYLEAARRAQALANVTTDAETKRKAKADADYFFAKARKAK